MGRQFLHDLLALLIMKQGRIQKVGIGELYKLLDLTGYHRNCIKGRVDLGKHHIADRQFAANHGGFLIDDCRHLRHSFPFAAADHPRRKSRIAAMHAERMVLRFFHTRELVDALMEDRSLSDRKRIDIRHPDRRFRQATENAGRHVISRMYSGLYGSAY